MVTLDGCRWHGPGGEWKAPSGVLPSSPGLEGWKGGPLAEHSEMGEEWGGGSAPRRGRGFQEDVTGMGKPGVFAAAPGEGCVCVCVCVCARAQVDGDGRWVVVDRPGWWRGLRLFGPLFEESIRGEVGIWVNRGGAGAAGFSLLRQRRGTRWGSGARAPGVGRVLRPGRAWAGGARDKALRSPEVGRDRGGASWGGA